MDGLKDVFGVEGFGDVVGGAAAQGLLGGFDALVAGDDDDGQGFVGFFDFAEEVEAVQLGHLDVEDDELGSALADFFHGFDAVGGECKLIGVRKDQLKRLPDTLFVVHDQEIALIVHVSPHVDGLGHDGLQTRGRRDDQTCAWGFELIL